MRKALASVYTQSVCLTTSQYSIVIIWVATRVSWENMALFPYTPSTNIFLIGDAAF